MKNAIATLSLLAIAATAAAQTAAPAPSAPPAAAVSTVAAAGAAASAGTQARAIPAGRTRADVIAEVLEARRNGTLIESEADMDVARTRQQSAR